MSGAYPFGQPVAGGYSQQVTDPPAVRRQRWLSVRNMSSETVPPFGLMMLKRGSQQEKLGENSVWLIDKPDRYAEDDQLPGQFLVNGGVPIRPQGYGEGTQDWPAQVLFESPTGSTATSLTSTTTGLTTAVPVGFCGPKADSWKVWTDRQAFMREAIASATRSECTWIGPSHPTEIVTLIFDERSSSDTTRKFGSSGMIIPFLVDADIRQDGLLELGSPNLGLLVDRYSTSVQSSLRLLSPGLYRIYLEIGFEVTVSGSENVDPTEVISVSGGGGGSVTIGKKEAYNVRMEVNAREKLTDQWTVLNYPAAILTAALWQRPVYHTIPWVPSGTAKSTLTTSLMIPMFSDTLYLQIKLFATGSGNRQVVETSARGWVERVVRYGQWARHANVASGATS